MWKLILSAVGLVVGAGLGYTLPGLIAFLGGKPSWDAALATAYITLLVGVPVGGLLGIGLGFWWGHRLDQNRQLSRMIRRSEDGGNGDAQSLEPPAEH